MAKKNTVIARTIEGMLSEEDIKSRLEAIGYKQGDIRLALRDVSRVIVTQTAVAYLARLPKEEQEKLRAMSEEELFAYGSAHPEQFPKMSQEEFARIHDETWEDYFTSVA